MSEEKFTQGVWTVNGMGSFEVNPNQISITVEINKCRPALTIDEYIANADLIAAAPDMYRALKRAEKLKDKDSMFDRVAIYEEMELALAKARGEL